jgi:prolyl oligopeptidase PreP (S9A serine peptidase family)
MDERVEPAQAHAMALALQDQVGMEAPVYLRVEPNDGHTAPTAVDVLTFIAKRFGIKALRPLV